jgi:hypothetical protein
VADATLNSRALSFPDSTHLLRHVLPDFNSWFQAQRVFWRMIIQSVPYQSCLAKRGKFMKTVSCKDVSMANVISRSNQRTSRGGIIPLLVKSQYDLLRQLYPR